MAEITSNYIYGGMSDYGLEQDVNEDYIAFEPLREDILLAIVADGAGSRQSNMALQPAVIAVTHIVDFIKHVYAMSPKLLEDYPTEILKSAMLSANSTIGAFQVANESLYSGFAVCASCCIIIGNRFYFAHAGNTRIYLIRRLADDSVRLIQMTHDHTAAAKLVDEGTLQGESYYSHPWRYRFTSALGISADPVIQTYSASFKQGDLVLMTTDGIHYAIRPEAMTQFVLESADWRNAITSLMEGAKYMNMTDNMSAAIIYNLPPNIEADGSKEEGEK